MGMPLLKIGAGFLSVSIGIIIVIWNELSSLPAFSVYLRHRMDMNINYFLLISGSILAFFVVPIFCITFIHASFKKYIFNHRKPVRKSFNFVVLIFCLSQTCFLFLFLVEFLCYLSTRSPVFYFRARLARVYPMTFLRQNIVPGFITVLFALCGHFILGFLIAETLITYSLYRARLGFLCFLRKNAFCILAMLGVGIAYLCTFSHLSTSLTSNESPSLSFLHLYYALIINISLLYIYAICIFFEIT